MQAIASNRATLNCNVRCQELAVKPPGATKRALSRVSSDDSLNCNHDCASYVEAAVCHTNGETQVDQAALPERQQQQQQQLPLSLPLVPGAGLLAQAGAVALARRPPPLTPARSHSNRSGSSSGGSGGGGGGGSSSASCSISANHLQTSAAVVPFSPISAAPSPFELGPLRCRRLAEALLRCGKAAEAVVWSEHALAGAPWDVELLLLRGKCLEASGSVAGGCCLNATLSVHV